MLRGLVSRALSDLGLPGSYSTALPLWGFGNLTRSTASAAAPVAAASVTTGAGASGAGDQQQQGQGQAGAGSGLATAMLVMHNVTLELPAEEFVVLRRAALRGAAWRESRGPEAALLEQLAAFVVDPLLPPSPSQPALSLAMLTAFGFNATAVKLVPDGPVENERISGANGGSNSSLGPGLGLGLGLGLGAALLLLAAGAAMMMLDRRRHCAESAKAQE